MKKQTVSFSVKPSHSLARINNFEDESKPSSNTESQNKDNKHQKMCISTTTTAAEDYH